MQRIILCTAIVAVLGVCSNSAHASDLTEILRVAFGTDHHSYRHAAQHAHTDHHADLRARAIERNAIHHDAHHYPLTTGQHIQLHNDLNRAARLDAVEHRTAHATQAYSPRYIPSYRNVPYGYGAQVRSSYYPPQTRAYPLPYPNPATCSPYGPY